MPKPSVADVWFVIAILPHSDVRGRQVLQNLEPVLVFNNSHISIVVMPHPPDIESSFAVQRRDSILFKVSAIVQRELNSPNRKLDRDSSNRAFQGAPFSIAKLRDIVCGEELG